MNKFLVSFDRTFTGGTLVGITTRGSVSFGSWQSANDFAAVCDGKTVRQVPGGGSPAILSRPILEAVEAKRAA